MSKPYIHALSSVKRWGGEPEDYLEIHNLLDKSKGTIADSRHRALTHNAWFISEILERIFGVNIAISSCHKCGKKHANQVPDELHGPHHFIKKLVSVRDIGEQHVLEDFNQRFIPSAQDYLEQIPMQEWMICGKGAAPPSMKTIESRRTTNRRTIHLD